MDNTTKIEKQLEDVKYGHSVIWITLIGLFLITYIINLRSCVVSESHTKYLQSKTQLLQSIDSTQKAHLKSIDTLLRRSVSVQMESDKRLQQVVTTQNRIRAMDEYWFDTAITRRKY